MMLLVTWTSSIGMVEGTEGGRMKSKMRVELGRRRERERKEKWKRSKKDQEGKEWKEREEDDRGSIPTPSMQLTSLQSGDIFTDIPPTGISVLGRHSILTTHKHHILCEWCETCDHTLSHVDSTIYGRKL